MLTRGYVYILASKPRGTLYIGVTSDLVKRIRQHQGHETEGFTSRYHVHHLVYYELFDSITSAIQREKQLKHWHRAWKISLIESVNPNWIDVSLLLAGNPNEPFDLSWMHAEPLHGPSHSRG